VGNFRWYPIVMSGALCLSVLVVCTACIPGANQQQSLTQIQSQIAVLSNEMQESFVKSEEDRVSLYKQLNEDITLLQKNQADGSVSNDELRASLQAIDAKLDEYNVRMEKLQERLNTTETALTERINFLADQVSDLMTGAGIRPATPTEKREPTPVPETSPEQPPPADTTSGPSDVTAPSDTTAPGLDQDASRLYHTAYMDYINGNFDTAITGFRKYLELYPDTRFTAISQYWIAESYFSLGEFETALREYDTLIKQYPESDRIPAAYFGKADACLKLDRQIEAIGYLKQIVTQFPQSAAARKAQERLQALGER
jgi:tol-pal system protein YbgF